VPGIGASQNIGWMLLRKKEIQRRVSESHLHATDWRQQQHEHLQTILGGGCLHRRRQSARVTDVGYSNGQAAQPSYEEVCTAAIWL
jgi:hypothetical protein